MTLPSTQPFCPPMHVLAAIAAGACEDQQALGHTSECSSCRAAVAQLRSNQQFLDDFLPVAAEGVASPQLTEVAAGAVVPNYQILGLIGRGGQGIVYKAVQAGTTRKVALKLPLHGELISDRDRLRFESEIKIVAGMRHPYIVTVYESGMARDGRFYVAMEYIRGLRLDRWSAKVDLRTGSPRSALRAKVELFAKVCDAVQYAHQRMIMHRDLKPGNILVDGDDTPRLLDFGIARPLIHGGLIPTITGQFVGTPAYASPEQVEGHPDQIDLRTDIYSLGVVLFEMVFGQFPYPTDCPLPRLIEHITETEPSMPEKGEGGNRAPAVDFDLRTIILKALSKDRERRYQTVRELADDLSRWLAGEAISARRDSTWYLLCKTVSRNASVFVAVGALALALMLGATGFAWQAHAARAQRDAATMERDRAQAVIEFFARILSAQNPADEGRQDITVAEAMSSALNRINAGELARQPGTRAILLRTMAKVLDGNARSDEALSLAKRALEIEQDLYPRDHAAVAASLDTIVTIMCSLLRFGEAEPLAARAVDIRRRLRQPDNPGYAESLDNLGVVSQRMGRLDEAEGLCKSSLEMRRRLFGSHHIETAQSLNNLGGVRFEQGRLPEAELLFAEAMAIQRTLYSTDHPAIAVALNNLAYVRHRLGRDSEAEQLYRESLEMRRRQYPGGHSSIATTLTNLALLLLELKRPDEAIAAGKESLELRRRIFGNEHRAVVDSLLCLSRCFAAIHRDDEARPFAKEAFAIAGRLPLRDGDDLRIRCQRALAEIEARLLQGDESAAGPAEPASTSGGALGRTSEDSASRPN